MAKSKTKATGMPALAAVCLVVACLSSAHAQTVATPDGYAQDATGGGNVTPQTVSSAADFKAAVSGDNPVVIVVDGSLNVGDCSIGSNKTIIGKDENAGLYGGRVAVNGNNYIIQNITFGPASGDVVEVSGGTNVFITRCAFHDCGDELCSIVREADYVTVSWCKFYFDNPHSHAFGHLIGNSDTRTTDRGKLHVTMHQNWYAEGMAGRLPRVRFGHVHIYNNYYNSTSTGYCIGIGVECHIRLENAHFDNVDDPWADYGGTSNGEIGWADLKFDACSQPTFMPNAFPVFDPPYEYSLDPVADVKALVEAGAGNVVGGTTPVTHPGAVAGSSRKVSSRRTPTITKCIHKGSSLQINVRKSDGQNNVYDLTGRKLTGRENRSATTPE